MSMKRYRKGFTLVEVMVTIAIIVILTGVILVSVSGSRGKARDVQRISDVAQIQFALQLFFDRCGQYPSSLDVLDTGVIAQPCPATISLGSFISQIPRPTPSTNYDYVTQIVSSIPVNYVIHTTLESYNAAIAKGLSGLPSWVVGNPFPCSNASNSVEYCLTSN